MSNLILSQLPLVLVPPLPASEPCGALGVQACLVPIPDIPVTPIVAPPPKEPVAIPPTLLPSGRSHMAHWRKRLYGLLARNAPSATAYFEIPPNRVIELGAQIEL